MATKWRSVRLRVETVSALLETLESMRAGLEAGKRTSWEEDYRNDKPSLDWVVRELIRERAAKSAPSPKRGRKAATD